MCHIAQGSWHKSVEIKWAWPFLKCRFFYVSFKELAWKILSSLVCDSISHFGLILFTGVREVEEDCISNCLLMSSALKHFAGQKRDIHRIQFLKVIPSYLNCMIYTTQGKIWRTQKKLTFSPLLRKLFLAS